jgi:phosphoglycerate kinase
MSANKRVLSPALITTSPLTDGRVADDTRLRESLPTLEYLLAHRAKIILNLALGPAPRARSSPNSDLILSPDASARSWQRPVTKLDECIGPAVHRRHLHDAPWRYHSVWRTCVSTPKKRPTTKRLPRGAGAARRLLRERCVRHGASGARQHLRGGRSSCPRPRGLLFEREVTMLSRAVDNPQRPFLAIVGGAKLADKIGVLKDLIGRVDAFSHRRLGSVYTLESPRGPSGKLARG